MEPLPPPPARKRLPRWLRITGYVLLGLVVLAVGARYLLAGRFVVPELLQDEATPVNLAQALLNLFDDTVTRRRLDVLFGEFATALQADTGALAADAVATELHAAGVAV